MLRKTTETVLTIWVLQKLCLLNPFPFAYVNFFLSNKIYLQIIYQAYHTIKNK